ncbi:hypothetical protein K466DRAFT_662322 [Polyporus arcularius HHB13444]|uniref:RING-type domain-containing protein n=1 Tax=Polyporus arcularius HHB13444 TaxID=1314778 RepID=A0A5C3PGQ5_9APHY|nr:hypothetical protein K466DRAFT_662322 [Polyporus arcularius HHB13444]
MPPAVAQNNNASTRRSTGSARQRENRLHAQSGQAGTGSARRRKSRSPEARVAEEAQVQADVLARRKKRLPPIPGASSSNPQHTATLRHTVYEDVGDRGRIKPKPKPRAVTMLIDEDEDVTPIITNIVQDHPRLNNVQRSKRKDRSRSRETAHRHSRKTGTPDPLEDEEEHAYTGPLAHAEFTRMKLEMENLRKQMAMAKKTITKQSKVIDELRAELTNTNETHRTQRAEMEKLKTQSKKSDDLIASIESNLTCQVCMEIMLKPYGLSPCGHVLCMSCLLEWFKAAPPGVDEMDDDDYPNALLYRKKTCPCCRTTVHNRPIPLYVVKSLASAVDKSKVPAGALRPSPPPDDEDPWAGIFRDDKDFAEYWSTDEDDEDDDEDGEMYDDEDDYWSFDGYGTAEDDEPYNGPYVNPRWAPPTIHVDRDDYDFLDEDAEEFSMLRRGATLAMIGLFNMTYDHDTGICAVVDGENLVYLGWNVELHPDDETGEEYMDWILADMYDRPERWRVINDDDAGTWTAWRLVPEDENQEHDQTDSEVWAEDMEADEDDY